MKIEKTEYGCQFIDLGKGGILQQSRFGGIDDRPGSSHVWLGKKDHRMHLSISRVRELVKHLTNWLEKGEF